MVRGKRTGAVNATVFFDEFPQHGHDSAKTDNPRFSLAELRELENVKQGAKLLGSEFTKQLLLERETKRKSEYQAYKDEQKAQQLALDAHLESVRAKFSTSSISGLQPANAAPSAPDSVDPGLVSSSAPDHSAPSVVFEALEGMSELDQVVISHRLKTSQLKLKAIATKEKMDKFEAIFEVLPHLTEEEVQPSLLLLGDDEFDVMEEYDRYPELRELRRTIARKHTEEAQKPKPKVKRTSSASRAKASASVDVSGASLSKPLKGGSKKTALSSSVGISGPLAASSSGIPSFASTPRELGSIAPPSAFPSISSGGVVKEADEVLAALLPAGTDLNYVPPREMDFPMVHGSLHEDDDSGIGVDEVYELDGEDYATRTHKKKKQVTVKKLRLDDAIAQGSTEGWSAARVRAWNLRHENPNAYYYRFNQPGEEQRNGKWTESERERFFARMNEVGLNGQWGIFAKEIYGRVGYQCANFYRQMIENNEIEDPRYVIDESGKAHFLFSKRKKKAGNGNETTTTQTARNNATEATTDECEDNELASMEGMTKITRDGKDIYIPKINVPIRRTTATPRPNQGNSSRSPNSLEATSSTPSSTAKEAKDAKSHKMAISGPSSAIGTGVGTPAIPHEDVSPNFAATVPTEVAMASSTSNSMEGVEMDAVGAPKRRAKSTEAKEKKKNLKKRKRVGEEDEEEYKPSSSWSREKAAQEANARLKDRLESNPLPGFKDVITNAELIQPAISPYGHVLSYATWIKCLMTDPKNTCPFTKQPLKKRDLIILTWENIEAHQDKIDRSGQS